MLWYTVLILFACLVAIGMTITNAVKFAAIRNSDEMQQQTGISSSDATTFILLNIAALIVAVGIVIYIGYNEYNSPSSLSMTEPKKTESKTDEKKDEQDDQKDIDQVGLLPPEEANPDNLMDVDEDVQVLPMTDILVAALQEGFRAGNEGTLVDQNVLNDLKNRAFFIEENKGVTRVTAAINENYKRGAFRQPPIQDPELFLK